MPSETQMEHPPTALLVGDVTRLLAARTDRAADAGWRFHQVPDVYAAAARLLRPDKPKPDVVLVLVESLRGDELRFFDFLARRWPGVPAAALYGVSAEDRRLQACRSRKVTVVSADGLVEWLASQGSVPRTVTEPTPVLADDAPASPSDPDDPPAALAQPSEYPPDDLPDLPDEVDEPDEYTDLPDAPAPRDLVRDEELPLQEPDPEQDHQEQDLPDCVPLTPWSNVPRPERRRKPNAPLVSPFDSRPPPPSSPVRGWEHGLLTPEELRALLQDPDESAGQQEARP